MADFMDLMGTGLGEQIPPGGRNELYRRRQVRIDYWYSKSGSPAKGAVYGDGSSPNSIELVEVTAFNVQTQGSTATSLGPLAPVLQPWYFQPFKIEIQGRSYIGAFGTNRLNVGVDTDVKKILEMREFINADFRSGNIRKLRAVLSCKDPNDASNFEVSQEFEGFVDDISINENQDNPYIKEYSLKFTGESKASNQVRTGSSKSKDDVKAIQESHELSVSRSPLLETEDDVDMQKVRG